MAHLLKRGLTLGQDLVEALMSPDFNPRFSAPGTDQDMAIEGMAIEFFNEYSGMEEETWGQAARRQVMQWSRLLTDVPADAH
ncbi:hypothetical protein SODALDRAFT_329974 [Sodiomyces alkalinus F11]|uniref:Uncharacterized protein n=1 Tax=Sodiomyces alkalinus (strain CBS 110278 / VKM F-3762 / F11) TaxID=1314773 RepID=A0A3N2Q0I9_SODAK|nr:hypothetical protein SODALDRAFT_329974 [Sodiomyces alkalinus F11]ROT40273.1 hypothetical protein SODALDRAFT_329974 [Sodiomyces alkalinus F11]